MKTLLQIVKEDQLTSRKAKEGLKSRLLTYLIGEVGRQKVKDESDVAVMAVIKKVKKNLEAAVSLVYTDDQNTEICILSEYLPEIKTGEDLEERIDVIISDEEDYNMGSVMGKLKAYSFEDGYDYDGKEASVIVRKLIAQYK